ncbi:pentatricopeptide repeat-containing protein At2g13600-like [Phoenix dactylifera]|uniref:Pentatricopeptide repeat-containing protein At2g13600-like n=1 Tax=Phoenix dactylifera TaxID=42345 RepID=A0A8B8J7W4_PHODC|nr:pentatricopeptide repeat-containing protein At2g13600-like [Phoenix dactylifera]
MPHTNPSTARAVITALCRAGQVAKAREVFDGIKNQRTPDCLNAMIAGYALNGCDSDGLQLFRKFQTSGFDPDEFTLSRMLSISANLNALDEGKQIHNLIVKKNLAVDVAVNNSLINLYFKCKSVGDAEMVFSCMPERDVYTWTVMVSGFAMSGSLEKAMDSFNKMPCRNTVSWNSMISAYQSEGYDEMALDLFYKMREQGEAPNKPTFLAVLKACASQHLLETGQGVHCCLVKLAWIKNVDIRCTLMDMYVKCGELLDVQRVFNEISEHNVVSRSILVAGYAQNGKIEEAERIFSGLLERNVISWNVMIAGYVQNGMLDRAFGLFIDMIKDDVRPNCFTLTILLSGCSSSKFTRSGKKFHGYVMKVGLQSNISIGNSLITMYGEQGNVGYARLVFDTMPQYDVISCTAIVAAYTSNNDVAEARNVFDQMPQKNLISWNTMMFGYLQNSKHIETNTVTGMTNLDALSFFYEMEQSELKPDQFSYNCALSACAAIGALEQARAIHCRAIKRGLITDLGVGNALITVYGKCGALNEAEMIFHTMTNPDMISWNALLTGYSQNGRGSEVLDFYEKMQNSGVQPNHVTFISLLTACSYLGEVVKGQQFFYAMEKEHSISPTKEHYACMVDLLGRAGHLKDAESIIVNMPIEPDAAVWGALLGACKIYGDTVIGRRAADQFFHLEPNNSSAYIALAETFAAARLWEDVANLRAVMKEKRLLKEPGCSWIEIRNQKHMFLSGDSCHQQKDSIYATLYGLYSSMIEESYVLDSDLLVLV